ALYRVGHGAPVISDLKPGYKYWVIGYHFSLCEATSKTITCLYGYDLDKKEYSTLPNFEFNVLSFIGHPDSKVFGQIKVDRKSSIKKISFQKNNKKQEVDSKLPEFISLCADDKKECQKCYPEFIAKKFDRIILEQPKCKNAINKKLHDHCFALVFNPEAVKK
ncbi:23748_t:CDS:1, partial [Racocetra persica]